MNYIIIGQRRNDELEKLEEYLSLKKKIFYRLVLTVISKRKMKLKLKST